MKVLFLVHGYPPELSGGTERHVQQLAEWIAIDAIGPQRHEVVVCAGTLQGGPGAIERTEVQSCGDGATIRVLRLPRTDLYYDHWQKSSSPAIHTRVRELIRSEQPDVVAVHHWTRLSRDLVLAAAREGVPATVHLHDYWTSCPIAFRIKPTAGSFCESSANGMVCPPCAGTLTPFTPWVQMEEHFIALAGRQADLRRELKLARTVSAPSHAHAIAALRFMDGAVDEDQVRVISPARLDDAKVSRGAVREPDGAPWVFAQWGGLSRLKGTDVLFEAIAGLRDPSVVRLELAGVEERVGFLADLHARFPSVTFKNHGPFDADELHRHPVVHAHAAIIATRAHESYGFTLDESLNLGLPCAVVDVPAFRERVREGVGVRFFERNSAGSLRDLLQSWIDDPTTLRALRRSTGEALVSRSPADSAPERDYLQLLHDTIALGPPDPTNLPPADWYSDRIRQHALEEWDRRLSQCSAEELGLD